MSSQEWWIHYQRGRIFQSMADLGKIDMLEVHRCLDDLHDKYDDIFLQERTERVEQ